MDARRSYTLLRGPFSSVTHNQLPHSDDLHGHFAFVGFADEVQYAVVVRHFQPPNCRRANEPIDRPWPDVLLGFAL